MRYALNVSSRDRCTLCIDGWVELAGTEKRLGVVYSRGRAPCKWCEQGKQRYERMVVLKEHPDMNYEPRDVVVPDADPRPFRPNADFLREMERDFKTPRSVLRGLYPRSIWPSEWPDAEPAPVLAGIPSTNETAEYERKKRAAAAELERGTGTVELPAEPASDPFNPPYDPDEIPF